MDRKQQDLSFCFVLFCLLVLCTGINLYGSFSFALFLNLPLCPCCSLLGGGATPHTEKLGEAMLLTVLVPFAPVPLFQGVTLSPDQALFDAGFDSLGAEEFVGKLQERLVQGGWVSGGLREAEELVSSTTVFDCPTARHIAEHVDGLVAKVGGGGSAEATTSLPTG